MDSKIIKEYREWLRKKSREIQDAGAHFGCVLFHTETEDAGLCVTISVAADKAVAFKRECDDLDFLVDHHYLRDIMEDELGVCALDDGHEWDELMKCEDPWKVYDHYREYGCIDTIKEVRYELEIEPSLPLKYNGFIIDISVMGMIGIWRDTPSLPEDYIERGFTERADTVEAAKKWIDTKGHLLLAQKDDK